MLAGERRDPLSVGKKKHARPGRGLIWMKAIQSMNESRQKGAESQPPSCSAPEQKFDAKQANNNIARL